MKPSKREHVVRPGCRDRSWHHDKGWRGWPLAGGRKRANSIRGRMSPRAIVRTAKDAVAPFDTIAANNSAGAWDPFETSLNCALIRQRSHFGMSLGLGRRMVKTAPDRSVRLLAVIVPPIASMKPRQMERPRPVPART